MQYTVTVHGVFVLDDKDSVVDVFRFPDDPEKIAERIAAGTSDELEAAREEHDIDEQIMVDPLEIAQEAGIKTDHQKLHEGENKVGQALSRQKIAEEQSRDDILVQSVRTIDDIDSTTNKRVERLRAWYSVAFPELESAVDDHEELARIAAEAGDREEAAAMAGIEADSTGMELFSDDREMLAGYARTVFDSMQYRKELEQYVGDLADQVVPNLSAVVGPVLAARLVSEAGSLQKLSKMPSSTVQVLGAEKALFRHMRGEGSAPKHGVIFMHRTIRNLPENKRGKMARFLANKATIAARLDRFDGSFKGETYRNKVDERFEELREES